MAKLTDMFIEGFSTSAPSDMKNPSGLKQLFQPVTKPQPFFSLAEGTPSQKIAEYEDMIGGPYRDRPATGFEDAW